MTYQNKKVANVDKKVTIVLLLYCMFNFTSYKKTLLNCYQVKTACIKSPTNSHVKILLIHGRKEIHGISSDRFINLKVKTNLYSRCPWSINIELLKIQNTHFLSHFLR
jgi:hypothetical protein